MRDLIAYVVLGSALGFGAAIQPGPFQAFLVSRVVAIGWRRALPVCVAPLLSDGPIAVLAILVLGHIPPIAQHVLRASGGVLLLYFAARAVRIWRQPASTTSDRSAPRTIVEAALVNLLNPNPYVAWALVMGPAVVTAWNHHPAYAVGFVATFYATMFATNAGIVLLVGTARFLNSRSQRRLVLASALLLGVLGMGLLAIGVRGIWGGR